MSEGRREGKGEGTDRYRQADGGGGSDTNAILTVLQDYSEFH